MVVSDVKRNIPVGNEWIRFVVMTSNESNIKVRITFQVTVLFVVTLQILQAKYSE